MKECEDSTVQFSSVAQSCPTLCDPMNRSTPGLPVHHHLPEFTQTHSHRVRDAIQPSHPRSSPSPPAPNPSQHQSLFQWVNSSHEVAKAQTMKKCERLKYIPHSWIGRINFVKVTILSKAIYRFNIIPIKIPVAFFTELEQVIIKCVWKHKRQQIAKTIWERRTEEEPCWRNHAPWLQTILQDTVVKTVWYWLNKTDTLINRTEPRAQK